MKKFHYIIAGSGAAGLQIAYRMSKDVFFDQKTILIIDQDKKENNDRTWCYWERGEGEWDAILEKQWDKATFIGEGFSKTFELGDYRYKMLRSGKFYAHVIGTLNRKSNVVFAHERVIRVASSAKEVEVVTDKSSYVGEFLISSIADLEKAKVDRRHPFLLQHFGGWFVRTKTKAYDSSAVGLMDFSVPQNGNTAFMYVLPVSECEALVEFTLFSKDVLKREDYDTHVRAYLEQKGITEYEIVEKEFGQIPMTTYPFHLRNEPRTLYVGTAGGWTRPSTGYTFYNSGKKALELCSFLKEHNDMTKFMRKTRFGFYDFVVLDVLLRRNDLGKKFFTSIYAHQPIGVIFDFLNGESTLVQELKIILRSKPRMELVKSVFRYLMR